MKDHSVLVTPVTTALVAFLPDAVVAYFWKIVSVLVLAMVAEAGRRLVGKIWRQK